jgi:transposase
MRVPLAQQAQEILGHSDVVSITERVDDVALLIGQMVKRGFVEGLDRPLPRHWKQRRGSWGGTAVLWLASLLTEGDHRHVSVEAYIPGMHNTLSHLSGQRIAPLDCRDDRVGHLLQHVSTSQYWHEIAQDLTARSLEVYDLSQDVIRCDATTVSGDHDVTAEGLGQFGHSTDDPTRPQITVLMGSWDPLGRPLATEVWSGERADEGFSMALIERIEAGLHTAGLLCVGDWKRSALATRAHLVGRQHGDLSPVPCTGATAEAMAGWIPEGIAPDRDGALEQIVRVHHRGQEVLVAEGYACARSCGLEAGAAAWSERVLVVRSPAHAERQAAGREKRLAHAETTLAALTPARGRGTRQISDEATLLEAMAHVLKEQRVDGLRTVAWERPVERHTHDVGRGRGSAKRAPRGSEHIRSPITRIARQEGPSAALTHRCGWKAFVTNAAPTRRSLAEAILCSRNAYRLARIFYRLKSRVPIAPLCVTRDDHLEGLTSLLTGGVRV